MGILSQTQQLFTRRSTLALLLGVASAVAMPAASVDSSTVQTGSFNYSQAAAKYNSENVVVLYGQPRIAGRYLYHWRSRFDQAPLY